MNALTQRPTVDIEQQLISDGRAFLTSAQALTIVTAEDYQRAADVVRQIKARQQAVTNYWQTPKASAKAAHQALCDREKQMLQPLVEAEKAVKDAILGYKRTVEAEAARQREEMRRKQQEEAERLLQAAVDAEAAGDLVGSETNVAMAQMVSDMKVTAPMQTAPVAVGTSTRKVWRVRVTDEKAVPIELAGVTIRPVDMAALVQLARTTKGTIAVPGVEFYQEEQLSVRQ